MSNRHALSLALLIALYPAFALAEPLKYSGSLIDAGQPAEGAYALRVSLYDAASGGRRVGKELTLADVPVSAGRFSAELDFGLPSQLLEKFWMQVEVAGPEGVFQPLGKRESLDAKALAGAACWSTGGNTGISSGSDFLGTVDDKDLVIKVNSQEVWRFASVVTSPVIIGGHADNSVQAGVVGATIAGGGLDSNAPGFFLPGSNRVLDHLGTVSGGYSNWAGWINPAALNDITDAISATVGGGDGNRAEGPSSTVAGGSNGRAAGAYSAVGGGASNEALGEKSVVPGGTGNKAFADYSFAAGSRARALAGHDGSFVWSGSDLAEAFETTAQEQFLVRASAGVGINMNKPASSLHVRHELYGPQGPLVATPDPGSVITAERDSGNVFISIIGSATAQRGILFGEPGSVANGAITYDNGGSGAMEFRTNGNVTRMRIDADGATRNTTGAWSTLSDARVKRNVEDIADPLAMLLALRGHRFEYTHAAPEMGEGKRLGFVAQEVRGAIPEWVREGSDGYLSVTPTGFEALTVEAIRELADENVALQSDNAALQSDNVALHTANEELRDAQASLAKRLAAIEAQLRQRTR